MGERGSSLVLALREWFPARAAQLALLLLLGYILAAWPLGSVALAITGSIATFLLLLYP